MRRPTTTTTDPSRATMPNNGLSWTTWPTTLDFVDSYFVILCSLSPFAIGEHDDVAMVLPRTRRRS